MANFPMQAFQAAQFAGQQLNAELDNTRANAAMKQEEVATMRQNNAMRQQQQQMQQDQQAQLAKIIGQYDEEQKAQKVDDGTAPDDKKAKALAGEVDLYRKIGKSFALSDPGKMESYMKLADAAEGRSQKVQESNQKINEKHATAAAAYAGAVLQGDVSPQEAFKWVKDNIGLKDAMDMPTEPEKFKSYWRAKQTEGTSAKEQLENKRKVDEDVQKAKDRKEALEERRKEHLDREADRAAQREILKSSVADRKEAAVERKAKVADEKDRNFTEKLNKQTQAQAKPFLEDKQRVQDIEGLLDVNTSAADQQIHQAMTSFLGGFKGRATNLFYKDNKNFGSAASRVSGFLSHAFTGRYQESDRKEIRDMMAQLKNDTIEPALAGLEKKAKEHAKGYGLKTDQIEIQGDFNREAKPKADKPQTYQEGQTAKNPSTGAVMVYRNGKWVAQ